MIWNLGTICLRKHLAWHFSEWLFRAGSGSGKGVY